MSTSHRRGICPLLLAMCCFGSRCRLAGAVNSFAAARKSRSQKRTDRAAARKARRTDREFCRRWSKPAPLRIPLGQEGLASITAELLRKGTKKRTAQQFAADLDFTGGSFEADAGADYSSVSGEFLNKDISKGLELISDALLHPIFPQPEVDKLLAQSLDAVRAAKDDPRSVLATYYNGYLFNGTDMGERPTATRFR